MLTEANKDPHPLPMSSRWEVGAAPPRWGQVGDILICNHGYSCNSSRIWPTTAATGRFCCVEKMV